MMAPEACDWYLVFITFSAESENNIFTHLYFEIHYMFAVSVAYCLLSLFTSYFFNVLLGPSSSLW